MQGRAQFAERPDVVVKPFHLKDVVGQVDRLERAVAVDRRGRLTKS